MITRIREVRKARGMTLDDVAKACRPATTAQTIGRLETGTRTVSIGESIQQVCERFKITENQLEKIQEEGIAREWPPLEQAV